MQNKIIEKYYFCWIFINKYYFCNKDSH